MSILATNGHTRVIYEAGTIREVSASERIPDNNEGCHGIVGTDIELHRYSLSTQTICDCGLRPWPTDFD